MFVCRLFKVSSQRQKTSFNISSSWITICGIYFNLPHLNMKTQKIMCVSFSLSMHMCCSCNTIFSSFSFNTTPLSFQPPKSLLTLSLTLVCQQSYSHGKLFSKQCMVLTLRWKRHVEIILAGWYHTASFPNGTRNLTFSWSQRCQKMTFVHSIT